MFIKILKLIILIWVFCLQFEVNTTSLNSHIKFDTVSQNNYFRTIRSLIGQNNLSVCGKPVIGRGTIIGGTDIIRGSFPWLAALVIITGKFFCGGSLITSTKVVSAAHCVLQKNEKSSMLPRSLKILLGVHDLNDMYEVGRVATNAKFIHIHPDWNPNAATFDADISVLELEKEVQFSEYIRPICLIDPHSEIAKIDHGVIVGYGKSEDETKIHENLPKSLRSPIIYHRNCSETFADLASFLSNRAFCGGNTNGSGTCTGDSGSGLFVRYGKTYYLRGIVSSSLMSVTNDCNTSVHSILTDVLNFNEWITFDTMQIVNSSSWSTDRLKSLMFELTQNLSENTIEEMIKTLQEILIQKKNKIEEQTNIYIPSDCTDIKELANCELIVKGNYCSHKYYAKHCCRSCTIAGQLTWNNESH